MATRSCIIRTEPMGQGVLDTLDPFLFCVYHKDLFPAGNDLMEAPKSGNGADFTPGKYRMYHGDKIPGFPQHPHRGFETITATLTGVIDHSDSLGNAGRYGHGDLQWMTAGKGICHSEMFPLINTKKENPCRFFQIWLNLPAKNKMVDPAFKMHWAEKIPHILSKDGKVDATVWAGSLNGTSALQPPPASFAAQPGSDVAIWFLKIRPGGSFDLPPAAGGSSTNRVLYFLEGASLHVTGTKIKQGSKATLAASQTAKLFNQHASEVAEVLILQGRPIGEPVAQRGPFVMNTQQEIAQAFADYQRTRFGGWPWPRDDMVFKRQKGRFALLNGKETRPSPAKCEAAK